MNSLFLWLRVERIKLRRSWPLLVAVLSPLTLNGFLFLIFWFSEGLVDQPGTGFLLWYRFNYLAWDVFFLPVTTALIGTLSWAMEEQGAMWKHLWAQPIPRWSPFAMKFMGHLALVLLAQGLLMSLLALGGLALRAWVPGLAMGPVRLGLLGTHAGISLLAMLPLVGLHTWLPARVHGLGPALTLAALGSWIGFRWSSHAVLGLVVMPWGASTQAVAYVTGERGPIWVPGVVGLGLGVVWALLGGWDVARHHEG